MPWITGHGTFVAKSSTWRDVDMISNRRVWVRIPKLPLQYRDAKILEVITQLIGTFIRADETTLSSLNGLFVRVLF